MAISAEDFRAGMALRAGGVAIVTAKAGDLQHGMTVTDYAGVSADPPLVLVCADKSSNTSCTSMVDHRSDFRHSVSSLRRALSAKSFCSRQNICQARWKGPGEVSPPCKAGHTASPSGGVHNC